jgi:predicted Zn-dependent protease
MPDSIEELARRWKAKPDAAGAVALFDALRGSSPAGWTALIQEVGQLASTQHADSGPVLLSLARLYTVVDRLSDAQALLVSAGRLAPGDPAVFKLLGEVLLRRGDAERAEKVLTRAKLLGAKDPETAMWLERAKVFKPIQAKAGARAVAVEVKNAAGPTRTPPPDVVPPPRPQLVSVDQDGVTAIRSAADLIAEATAAASARAPAPPLPRPPSPKLSAETETNILRGVVSPPQKAPPDVPLAVPTGPKLGATEAADADVPSPRERFATYTDERTEVNDQPAAEALEELRALRAQAIREEELRANVDVHEVPTALQPAVTPPMMRALSATETSERARAESAALPAARDVLEALSNAGVFEVREAGHGAIVWDRPSEKARRRTALALSIGVVVFILGSGGVYAEIQRRRARAHEEAEATLAKVEADLDASRGSLLPQVEQTLGHVFELDSRSPRAASDWLKERAIKGLLTGGAELAFEDAVARALEVKVPEAEVAYARVAAFLFQGDTGGAAGLMPKWDTPAANQPLYQLVTGATLERAGDPHAAERYQAAVKLAPSLLLADLMLARATAIDGDPTKAAELAKQFKTKYPDRAEGSALVALAWGRDPARGEQPPPEVAETIAHAGELPVPLLAVPRALAAILAIDKHAYADAKTEIEKGLAVANDPGMATWLGSIALETRDEPLVRKAALLAVTFSAVYAPARVLAGRIALLGGRLDEALKATEDLDPTSPDVAIVRAAAAYERVDADGLGRALEATSAEAKKLPIFGALNLASDVLLGRASATWSPADAPTKLFELSNDEAPWSDLIAMDVALDFGLTDVADKILADWKGTEDRPLKAARLSRLARYENRTDDADRFSKAALDGATVTPRILIERVMSLVAKNRAGDVGPLLAKYPLVLGPASSWLSAYALASTGKLDEARGRTAQLDFPPALAPLPFRVIAAVSLAAMKDKKRGEPAVKELLAAGSADPDLLAAAASLGIKTGGKPAKPGGKPKK